MIGERDLRKRVAALERRLATLVMVGTAEASEGGKTKVRFNDAGAEGKAFSSPLLAQASNAGKNGGGVSSFAKIGQGEPVLVISPGGELGKHSRVLPAGHVDDFPSPGTAEGDGQVIQIGDATVSIKSDEISLAIGSSSIVMKAGSMIITAADLEWKQS